uniref:Uncharacterized protein n=1 Tax=candidate division WOR-3 bacterium TaxID=2052148 RepID=A0A7C4XA82_UNCW3
MTTLLTVLFCSLDIIYTAGIGGEFLGCGCPGEEGGIARIAHYIKNTPHHLLIDAGGIFGKNRFVDSIALVNLKEYNFDAIAVSGNELQFGPEFINRLSARAPLLCSNVYYLGQPLAKEYIIKSVNGKKVLITAVIEEELPEVEVLEPKTAINRIKANPLVKDYDIHINILNGPHRRLIIENIGYVDADWTRRIGLLKIENNSIKNSVTFLDSTIPEDHLTREKINSVLYYLKNLPARQIISDFPATVSIIYYYNDDDSLVNHFLPLLVREYRGMVGITYIKKTDQKPAFKIGERIFSAATPETTIQILRKEILRVLDYGGDKKVQVVYFPNPNCPECGRYNLLLEAFKKNNPDIKIVHSQDEVLLERFYEVYEVPLKKRQKPIIFIGKNYLPYGEIESSNLQIEGNIPWPKIYGID